MITVTTLMQNAISSNQSLTDNVQATMATMAAPAAPPLSTSTLPAGSCSLPQATKTPAKTINAMSENRDTNADKEL
jgi:hypothetical protein